MNPWSIIGWVFVAGIGISSLLVVYAWARLVALPALRKRRLHRQTRDVAPAAGQMWRQGDRDLTIERIADNGHIVIKSYTASCTTSWSDSPDEWRDRVRERRLWLVQP